MPVLQLRAELQLQTRCENQIENEINREPVRHGDELGSADFKRNYPDGRHRPGLPSRQYNCHGLTFAARRTWIWKSAQIQMILKDDEYVKVLENDVLPGDIVLYSTNGDVEHSGVVLHKDRQMSIYVLSKWGAAHEVIHRVMECPYSGLGTTIAYYRINT